MPNIIDSIQISSSTFDVRDKSATTVVNLTQDEYDNLPSSAKTANVLYNITDATAGDLSQYWTSAQTQSAITEATSGKADTIYVDQSVSGKVDTTTFNTYSGNVETALSGKQDTLIAGENITISGNVISAEGGSITIDPSLDSGSTNPVANSAITTALNAKSDKGNFNNFILTSKNGNPGAMFKNDNGGSKILWLSKINGTKVFEISTLSQAANFSLVETSAITTSVTSASTDAQVPSAKAVYDAIQEGGGIDSGTVQTMIDESISGKTNQSDFVSHSGNTSIHVTTAQTAAWDAKSDFSGSYNDLSNKPTIPSKTSDLTNDSDFATTGDVQTATADMATKTWVGQQGYLTQHQSLSNYYTKSETSGATEISTALASKADKSEIPSLDGYATETWVEGKGYLTEHQDISGKLDVSAFNTYSGSVNTQLNSKASESDLNALNNVVTAHTANATIHVTAQDKTNWSNKSDFSGDYNDLTNKPTIPTVPTNVSDFTNDAGYITSDDITGKTNQADFVSHSGNTTMHVTASEKSTWNNKSDFSGSYNDLTDKPTIPTSASQLTNDSGYITSGDAQTQIDNSISGKVDATTFNTYSGNVETALSGKQDTLSAGTNITIVDNVISAEGGGKSIEAGRGISITTGETADTVSFNLPISAGTGENSIIIGDERNISSERNSVAEGFITSAMTNYAHSEGSRTLASGYSSHAEGLRTSATSEASHSEGSSTTASGQYSHSEGSGTTASGQHSHSEGRATSATTSGAHSEGSGTIASGLYSHSEGSGTTASGKYSHSEGWGTTASGNYSHSEGENVNATNQFEHSQGRYNVSNKANTTWGDSGNTLFSVGNGTANDARHNAFEIRQNGDIYLTKDGQDVKLQDQLGGGGSSYTAGRGIDVTNYVISISLPISAGTGANSIIEGHTGNTASGQYSHAEGGNTSATTMYAHTEGYGTKASGLYAHAEGGNASAITAYAHAEGNCTIAKNRAEHASGQYNVSSTASTTFGDSGNTLFSIGNGTSDSARHNAFEIRQNGDIYLNDGSKLQDAVSATTANTTALGGLKLQQITQSAYDELATKDSNTLYVIVN